jgi:DNA recombination protein RmuC
MQLLYLLAGCILGGTIIWFYARTTFEKQKGIPVELYNEADKERAVLTEKLKENRDTYAQLQLDYSQQQNKIIELSANIASEETGRKNMEEKLAGHKLEMEQIQAKMKEQFENIANRILFDNSQRIQQQHKEKLDDILNPLKEKIEKFENKVDQTHKENVRENQSLKEQLLVLQKLNQTIGEEAKNLTTALKGQVKTQGIWGELILEKVLEKSGLIKGREYLIQESIVTESGKRLQPDVVINLPDKKKLIIY